MKNNRFALFALLLVQLFYGVTFTFANDVIDGGYMQPYGFILFRVSLATVLFWLFSIWTPSEKIDREDFSKFMLAALFGVALNMLAFFKGLQFTTPIKWVSDYGYYAYYCIDAFCDHFWRKGLQKLK